MFCLQKIRWSCFELLKLLSYLWLLEALNVLQTNPFGKRLPISELHNQGTVGLLLFPPSCCRRLLKLICFWEVLIWPKLVDFDAFILIACCAAGSITRLSSTPRLVGEKFPVLLGGILTILLLLFVPKLFGTSWREPGTRAGADAPPSCPSTAPGDAQGAALALPRSSVLCSPVPYKQAMISLGCTLQCSCTFPCPKTWLSLHQDHREQRSHPPCSDLLHRYRLPSLAFSGLD